MTESMKYYESIRRKYPETVSKDQFYQIAHISKATALHLLQNGLSLFETPTSMSGSITGIISRLPVTSFPSAVKQTVSWSV